MSARAATIERARPRSRAAFGRNDSSLAECHSCHRRLNYNGRVVICNIYRRGVWSHLERYHPRCYRDVAREPYGLPGKGQPTRGRTTLKGGYLPTRTCRRKGCRNVFEHANTGRKYCGEPDCAGLENVAGGGAR